MLVIWTQREGRCGRCRSKTWGNLNLSLISGNVFPPPCFRSAWGQVLLVFLMRLLHLSYVQAEREGRCCAGCARLRAVPAAMSWFHEPQDVSSRQISRGPINRSCILLQLEIVLLPNIHHSSADQRNPHGRKALLIPHVTPHPTHGPHWAYKGSVARECYSASVCVGKVLIHLCACKTLFFLRSC